MSELSEERMKEIVNEFQRKVSDLFKEYNAKLNGDLDFMCFIHSNEYNVNNLVGFGCMACMRGRLNRRTGLKHNTEYVH